jgi:hypothetical protein
VKNRGDHRKQLNTLTLPATPTLPAGKVSELDLGTKAAATATFTAADAKKANLESNHIYKQYDQIKHISKSMEQNY